MKRQLLILASAMLATASANAQVAKEALIGADVLLSTVSPNGQFAAGTNMYGGVDFADFKTNEVITLFDPDGLESYSLGLGPNAISNDGAIVISTTYEGTASYYENGEIHLLPLPEGVTTSISNCITPDGNCIAGTVGVEMSLTAKVVMQRPVVWYRQADGSFGEPIILPYPEVDFTGRLPMYVLVDGISDDAHTLACQLVDYSGMFCQPMVIEEVEDGKWEYTLFADEFINPNNIEFPEYPGESPEPIDFMTDEEKAAYQQALAAAEEAVEPSYYDYMTAEEIAAYEEALRLYEEDYMTYPYPWIQEFMSEEGLSEYNAALDLYYLVAYPNVENYLSEESMAAYELALAEWSAEYEGFEMAFWNLLDGSAVQFDMNTFTMSPNAKYYATSGFTTDQDTFEERTQAYIFDLDTKNLLAVKTYEDEPTIIPNYVASDGRVLACRPSTFFDPFPTAYYAENIDAPLVPLHEVVGAKNPELYAWMEQNMVHEFTEWDPELEEDVTVEKWLTGVPACDANIETVVSWALNTWDWSTEATYFSYILPMNGATATGIDNKATESDLKVSIDGSGIIHIAGQAQNISVYDLNGRMLFTANNPGSTVDTGLRRGTYIVKVSNAKSTATAKALR